MSPGEPTLRRARLTVDREAAAANYRTLAELASPARVAAVVKADAYGLGMARLAPAFWRAGARAFFVARLEEGVALRAVLPEARIFVLDGVALGEPAGLLAHDLVPVLNQPLELARWRAAAAEAGRALPAALHLDTGMTRLGLSARQLAALEADALAGLDLVLVMSHLACAEELSHPLNEAQLARFETLRRRLPPASASLANSSGIFLGRAYRFDLCRPGVALYGVNPTPGRTNPMRPVVTLEAPILQVHVVDAPGSVGYGATWPARPGARVATVPVGYADGILRSASSRAVARVAGHEVSFAGRVSMDLITLDVSAVPEGLVFPGAPVELIFGPDGVDRLAEAAGTIGYEVLTRLGSRFERRYLDGDAA